MSGCFFLYEYDKCNKRTYNSRPFCLCCWYLNQLILIAFITGTVRSDIWSANNDRREAANQYKTWNNQTKYRQENTRLWPSTAPRSNSKRWSPGGVRYQISNRSDAHSEGTACWYVAWCIDLHQLRENSPTPSLPGMAKLLQ